MAKSTRSKVKRAFRAKKRTEGVFAATEAARLQRLNAKLRALATTAIATARGEGEGDSGREGARPEEENEQGVDIDMPVDDAEDASTEQAGIVSPTTEDPPASSFPEKPTGKISTHGPRGSRRDRWRASKGMKLRPKSRGMNRQGTAAVASRHKSGRPQRRR